MSHKGDLIAIYARNSLAQVGNDPDYRKLCDVYGAGFSFMTERDKVANAKYQLESAVGSLGPGEEQVRLALIALRRQRGADQSIFRDLIAAAYRSAWTPIQQAYFDMAAAKLARKYDFFLSFTNRNANNGAVNPINRSYKHVIHEVLAPEQIRRSDLSKENLFARACFYQLETPPRKGFFFPRDQYDNTVADQKLTDALNDSFVFLQLVQNVMFVVPTGGQVNFCFQEYKECMNFLKGDPWLEDRILFAVCEQNRACLIGANEIPFDYMTWHAHVQQRDVPYFEHVQVFSPTAIQSLLMLIDQSLGKKIDAAWSKLINGVPED